MIKRTAISQENGENSSKVIICSTKDYTPNDADFIEFSRQIWESKDYDPVYDILKAYFELNNFNDYQKLFGIHLYVTIYNTYWTLYLLEKYKNNLTWDAILNDHAVINKELKFGSDRRGIRAIGLSKVIPMYQEFFGDVSLEDYFINWMTEDGVKNYECLKKLILAIPQNGSWATYKHIDVLNNSGGYNIDCNDWWVKGRAFGGKQLVVDWKHGREFRLGKNLQESPEIIAEINDFADYWTARFKQEIDPNITYDVSETMACKYHATYGGTYYAGHDMDKMYEELTHSGDTKVINLILELRKQCFKQKDLVELCGGSGVRKELKGKIIL